jgi:LemA protein
MYRRRVGSFLRPPGIQATRWADGQNRSVCPLKNKKGDFIMLPTFITITVIVAVIVLWIISTQRRLVVLDENISNAMSQIGVQLSSRFDALSALLDLTKGYAKHESETLIETIKSRRSVITAKSTPDDVLRQEGVISEALGRIAMVTEQYPELKANQTYIKTMDAVQTFENMVRTSRLIYNDSVTKLNREIRMFPVSMIAGMLGFRQREYLVEQAGKADMPSMK